MDLKFFAIFLLLGAAAYAAPSNEVEEDDANGMGVAEDEDMAEDEPRRFKSYFSKGKYCICKENIKEDEPEMNEDDVDEQLEDIVEDSRKKKLKDAVLKLIRPFFKKETLSCHCTRNHAVVRLIAYIYRARRISIKQKVEFTRNFKHLIAVVVKQRKG